MDNAEEHQSSEPGGPPLGGNPGGNGEVLTRENYETEKEHLQKVWELRRAQDRKLLEVLETALNGVSERLVAVEEIVTELNANTLVMQNTLGGYEAFQERAQTRLEKHEERLGELETSVASLKAWILIVGGITGVASFLAIVLR